MEQPDERMQAREDEKTCCPRSLADVLAALRQRQGELDQWERMHLARGLAAVLSARVAFADFCDEQSHLRQVSCHTSWPCGRTTRCARSLLCSAYRAPSAVC